MEKIPCAGRPEFSDDDLVDMYPEFKELCATCPLLNQCRESAILNEPYGFWGGLTPQERKRERRKFTEFELYSFFKKKAIQNYSPLFPKAREVFLSLDTSQEVRVDVELEPCPQSLEELLEGLVLPKLSLPSPVNLFAF